jgi:site-specific recombinase XerD
VYLLRNGMSLTLIGDLLGHRTAESMCVYLRLNIEDLRNVALSIPRKRIVHRRKGVRLSDAPIFLNYRGEPLTRYGVRYILTKRVDRARLHTPTLSKKRLHPHSVRHSTAVYLLKSGVDLCTISHWLGHASMDTTNKYAKVDMEMKRQAIARAKTLGTRKGSAKPRPEHRPMNCQCASPRRHLKAR